ncbi:phosphoribosylglycinamide formyltransferase [Shouchella sp. JSM 1781072]|uniref:phosphoribosylglycinamide formyltransferase n=1 Tax=Bacillaceae TaxID=186817 RepID=UPI000C06949C|nr:MULTISPECIES: phosphoribosylglycinamide formyltransferase [Bacillaceae]UTR07482.1 phosphoribosylglycinamide formyltransferase [Alkalihalobacillus sp. LMS6]
MRLAIFASGSGTNAENLIQRTKNGSAKGNVVLVVSDKRQAPVLKKASQLGVETAEVLPSDFIDKRAYEAYLIEQLHAAKVELIVLAGYMRLIGPTLLEAFEGRIVNIHPSLLPLFPGLDAVGQALEAKAKETGVTIHYVDAGMDTGPVIAQEKVAIALDDDHASLTTKIQAVEHQLYPQVVNQIVAEKTRGENE